MKTTYFKDPRSGELECLKSYENGGNLRVSLTVDQERCKVYCSSIISEGEIFSLNEGAMPLSAGEALEEIDAFIEEIKRRTGYKNLQRQVSQECEPQAITV